MRVLKKLAVLLMSATVGAALFTSGVFAEEVETTISQMEQCNTGDGQGTQVDVNENGTYCCTEEPVHNYENI